jgi:hypothetical protein
MTKYPKGHPLHKYPGPDPRTVALCLPIGDFKPDWAYVTGILQCFPFFARPITYAGCSLVTEARNQIAHAFLHEHERFDWAVWIDSDIGFTPQDWIYLMSNPAPVVVAPYAKKTMYEHMPVRTGFGFAKVHRKVFEAIAALKDPDGNSYAREFVIRGKQMRDYFPAGVAGDGSWVGEDSGFLSLAAMAGFSYVEEWLCDVTHYGRHGFKLQREQLRPIMQQPLPHENRADLTIMQRAG